MKKQYLNVFVFIFIFVSCLSSFAGLEDVIKRAQNYIENKDYNSAITLLNSIPKKNLTESIFKKKIECYIGLNMISQAVEGIQKTCYNNIYNYSFSKNEWGDFLRKHGYKTLAKTLAKQLYEESKKDNNFWYWSWHPLFTSYRLDDEQEKIFTLFEDIISFEPSSAKYYVEYILELTNDLIKAEKILQKAVSNANLKPKISSKILFWTYKNLAEFYKSRGKTKKLHSLLKELNTNFQSDDPHINMEVYLYVGNNFKAYSHYPEALDTFNHALNILNAGKYNDQNYIHRTTINLISSIVDSYINQGMQQQAFEFIETKARETLNEEIKLEYYLIMIDILFYSYINPDINKIIATIKDAMALNPKDAMATRIMESLVNVGKEHENKGLIVNLMNKLVQFCDEKGTAIYAKYLSTIDKGESALEIIKKYITNTKSPKAVQTLNRIALEISAENRFFEEFDSIKSSLLRTKAFKSEKLVAELYETVFNNYDEAITYYKNAYKKKKIKKNEKIEMIMGMARCTYKKGDIANAEAILKRFIYSDTSIKNPHIYAAIFYRTVPKDYEKSINVLEQGLNLATNKKDKVSILLEIAKNYRIRIDPRPKKAIETYNKALELSDNSSIYEGLYLVYSNLMSDRETELKYLDILLNRDPVNPLYKIWMAGYLAESDKKDEALTIFHSIPGKQRGLYNTACMWISLGDTKKALELLKKDIKNHNKKGKYERNERRLWMATDQTLQKLRNEESFVKLVELEP